MNFKTAMKTVLWDKKFDFKTRASRSEYWWFTAGCGLIGFVVGILDIAIMGIDNPFVFGPVSTPVFALITIQSIAVTSRRLQDRGRSGWNQLWSLTIVGIIPLMYWVLMPAKTKKNKWGVNPKIKELKYEQSNLPI